MNEHPKLQGQWPWIFGGIALVLVVIAQLAGGSEDGRTTNDRDDGMARVMCEDFVEDRLVSPTSADFSRPIVRNAGGSDYWVAGDVDAENRLGATIRISYECTVRDEGDGSWTLQDMQHSER